MLTLVIVAFLAYCFYAGARRGMAFQAVYTIGYLVSAMVAGVLAGVVRPLLNLWVPYPSATINSKFVFFGNDVALKLDTAFYYGISFLFVFAICWAVVHLLALSVKELEYFDYGDELVNKLAGGVLNLLCGYVFMLFVLFVLALVPINGLQNMLGHSEAAVLMVRYTPVLSHFIANWWIAA